jgi:predicted esterase
MKAAFVFLLLLAPLLKQIAWETMQAEPLSGLDAASDRRPPNTIVRPTVDQVLTATTHAMRYRLSLPEHWSADQKWPVLVAPSAHYGDKGKSLALFAAERDAGKAGFIIVAPFVINADPVRNMVEYRGAVADAIAAADEATGDGGRDEVARAKFDEAGVCAVIRDVQRLYHGEDKVYITGFSSSTHIAYLFLFTHPELLKGTVINSGVYLGRGVDEDHIPLLNSPERAGIGVKFIIGENDPGYVKCSENWLETRAKLLRSGHVASKLEMEVIKKGNAASLGIGHQWYPTRILDFCAANERPSSR